LVWAANFIDKQRIGSTDDFGSWVGLEPVGNQPGKQRANHSEQNASEAAVIGAPADRWFVDETDVSTSGR
jgi:hypothetical protein